MQINSSKNTPKHSHLSYAAVYQDKSSYIKAVTIHYFSSILRLLIFGGIILTAEGEFIPVIIELIKNSR